MKIDISQLEFIDKRLRQILVETEKHFDVEFTITSLYRINDGGVHGTLPLRGTDLRCHDNDFAESVVSYVNQRWIYDTGRPQHKCCMYHDVGQGAHLHIQVHPNTVEV